jgi:hypothetical protein
VKRITPPPILGSEENGGNDGSMETVESQEQASPCFHEPLGNPAKSGLDSHIPTVPPTRLMKKWKTKTRFPTFPQPRIFTYGEKQKLEAAAAFALAERELR